MRSEKYAKYRQEEKLPDLCITKKFSTPLRLAGSEEAVGGTKKLAMMSN